MLQHLIEGSSPENYEAAARKALRDAVRLAPRPGDARIRIHELLRDKDDSYRAVLEVALELDPAWTEDPPQAPENGKQDRITIAKMVADYLDGKSRIDLTQIPYFILSHIKEEDLTDKIIVASEFQNAIDPEAAESAHITGHTPGIEEENPISSPE